LKYVVPLSLLFLVGCASTRKAEVMQAECTDPGLILYDCQRPEGCTKFIDVDEDCDWGDLHDFYVFQHVFGTDYPPANVSNFPTPLVDLKDWYFLAISWGR
jgi:hypothetical protein